VLAFSRLTWTSTVDFHDEIDTAELAAHLARSLNKARAGSVVVQGNCVMFTGGVFRWVDNWNILVPFGSGKLDISPGDGHIRYCLNFRQLVVATTALVGLMVLALLAVRLWQPLLFIPVGWLWVVGGNLMLGIPRFERFLRDRISTAPRLSIKPPANSQR
jgi:hypothetical protein